MLKAIVKLSLAYVYTVTFLYLCLVWPLVQGLEVKREALLYLLAPSSWLIELLYGTWLATLELHLSQQLGLVFALSVLHNLPILALVTALTQRIWSRPTSPSTALRQTAS
jgi:hypothetical protein